MVAEEGDGEHVEGGEEVGKGKGEGKSRGVTRTKQKKQEWLGCFSQAGTAFTVALRVLVGGLCLDQHDYVRSRGRRWVYRQAVGMLLSGSLC